MFTLIVLVVVKMVFAWDNFLNYIKMLQHRIFGGGGGWAKICHFFALTDMLLYLDHVYFVHPSTDISADISTDCRPMYRSTYRSSIGRYVGRHIGRQSVDMSTEMCRSTYRPMYIGRVMVDISTDYRQISRSI